MVINDCLNDWKMTEGVRLQVYDDATGSIIRPGILVKGHPTIGSGRALDVHGISQYESDILAINDIQEIYQWCLINLIFFQTLDPIRQRAIVNWVGNVGRTGAMKFQDFLKNMEQKLYVSAGFSLLNSEAAKQLPARYKWLSGMIRTGFDQVYGE